jgi:hypothetical protein
VSSVSDKVGTNGDRILIMLDPHIFPIYMYIGVVVLSVGFFQNVFNFLNCIAVCLINSVCVCWACQ